jgi:queuine tRNA-ribosyltransferase
MAGSSSVPARRAFSDGLLEILHGKEAEAIKPLKCLDDGVAGYVFDLVPLRESFLEDSSCVTSEALSELLQASLAALPPQKPRFVNTPSGPHEILVLIQHVGVDVFDAHWAQIAADVGVALDFAFPVRALGERGPRRRAGGKLDLGHNLYETRHAEDFGRLADCLVDGHSAVSGSVLGRSICGCIGCSVVPPATQVFHSSFEDTEAVKTTQVLPPYSRSYLHHLLHTHEMSSHSILVAHNLSVAEQFFVGIRASLASEGDTERKFEEEVKKFIETYTETTVLLEEAKICWQEVELARGKGRLARERSKT